MTTMQSRTATAPPTAPSAAAAGYRPSSSQRSSASSARPAHSSHSHSSHSHSRSHASSNSQSQSQSQARAPAPVPSSRPHSSQSKPSSSSTSSSKPSSSSHSDSRSLSNKQSSSKKITTNGSQPQNETIDLTTAKKRSQFMYDVSYRNELPLPPIQPKLLHIPLPVERLLRYSSAALALQTRVPFLNDDFDTLGLRLDAIDPEIYTRPGSIDKGAISAKDELLFSSDSKRTSTPGVFGGVTNTPSQAKMLEQSSSLWLRNPEYTANNLYEKGRVDMSVSGKRKIDLKRIKEMSEADTAITRLNRIEQTFEEIRLPLVHRTNPQLKPVRTWDIFPSDHINAEYTWIEFDDEPANMLVSKDNEKLPMHEKPTSGWNKIPKIDTNRVFLIRRHEQQQHGLYIQSATSSPTNNSQGTKDDESKRNEPNLEVNSSIPEATRDPSVDNMDRYDWVREYQQQPTPLVSDNNFIFLLGDKAATYARYNDRLKLAKRARLIGEDLAAEMMSKRPRTVDITWCSNEEAIEWHRKEDELERANRMEDEEEAAINDEDENYDQADEGENENVET